MDLASLKLIVAGSVFVSLALGWVGLTTSVRAAIQRYERHVSGEVEAGLHALFIDLSGQQLILIAVGLAGAIMLGVALVLPWPIALAAGLPGLLTPRLALRWIKNRRHRAFIEQLPDALQGLASSMRAGSNLGRGLELLSQQQAAPLGEEFALILRRQRLGEDLESGLNGLLARFPSEEVGLFRSAVVVSHQVGGDLAGTLDMLAATLRERAQVEERILALTAMGRMQGRVMMVLPIAIGGMLYVQQPLIMVRLVTEPIGWAVIALAAGMMGIASVAIRRIVAIDV